MQASRFVLSSLVGAVALAAAGSALAEPSTYAVEPNHTFVYFEAKHFGTSTVRGRFDKKDGSITIDPAAKTGKAEITVETGSINSGVEKFNGHLSSADFFDVAKFPTAKFVADKFVFDGSKVASVEGKLTLHGETQPVTLKATNYNCYQSPMFKKEVCGGDFETSFKRSAFGIKYGLPFIPDDVRLLIQIEAVKQ